MELAISICIGEEIVDIVLQGIGKVIPLGTRKIGIADKALKNPTREGKINMRFWLRVTLRAGGMRRLSQLDQRRRNCCRRDSPIAGADRDTRRLSHPRCAASATPARRHPRRSRRWGHGPRRRLASTFSDSDLRRPNAASRIASEDRLAGAAASRVDEEASCSRRFRRPHLG